MEHTIAILFHVRLGHKNAGPTGPVYMRITINGKRIVQSVNREVELSKWSIQNGRMKGTTAEANALNNYLDALKSKVYAAEREMVQSA